MKRNRTFIGLGIAIVVVGLALFLSQRHPAWMGPAKQEDATAQSTATAPSHGKGTPSAGSAHRTALTKNHKAAKPVQFQIQQPLATVNGVAITARDLLPCRTNQPDRQISLSPQMYNYLLDRAIVRELAAQQAAKEGITLTPSQAAEIEKLRESVLNRDVNNPGIVSHLNSPSLDAEVDFRVRQATDQMLLETLMSNAGVPPRYPTDQQIQDYYNASVSTYGPLPADPTQRALRWQQIKNQISKELAVYTLEENAAQRMHYIDQLKATANITINTQASGNP